MKKQILFAGLSIVLSAATFAQKKNVTDAILLMRKYNPAGEVTANKKIVTEAKNFIDLAAVNAETAEDLKMHLYRAEIYYCLNEVAILENASNSSISSKEKEILSLLISISTILKKQELDGQITEESKNELNNLQIKLKGLESELAAEKTKIKNVISEQKTIAVTSFKKVLDDPKKAYTADAQSFINGRADFMFNQGIVAYNAKKYADAANAFLASHEIKTYLGEDFKDAAVNTSLAANYAVEDLLAAKKYDEAIAFASGISAAMPNNIDILISLVNINLQKGDVAATETYINKALALDPLNKQLYYVLGTSYMDKKENDKATAALKKAIEIDPNYNEALYQLGAHLYNLAVEKRNAGVELDYKDPKAAKLEAEAMDLFKQALEPLEKYASQNADDKAILDILYKTNMKLGNIEKAKEYKTRLDALKG